MAIWTDTDIEFRVVQYRPFRHRAGTTIAFLVRDRWDDFGFKTSFDLFLGTESGVLHELGPIKVAHAGLAEGFVDVPASFTSLGEGYFSLGQKSLYYEELARLNPALMHGVLVALRDVAFNDELLTQHQQEESLRVSLMRWVDSEQVRTFRDTIRGVSRVAAPFSLSVQLRSERGPTANLDLDFAVRPQSMPPTNVHALIGRNGVGKSRLLHSIASALTSPLVDAPALHGWYCSVDSTDFRPQNLVLITFSSFDELAESAVTDSPDLRYDYVGLRKTGEHAEIDRQMSGDELWGRVRSALSSCHSPGRIELWRDAISVLESSDPYLGQLGLLASSDEWVLSGVPDDGRWFRTLSSGHKAVLFAVASLVSVVEDSTVVLFDEPESHLHPPLLSSLVRVLATILKTRNGLAILATHSPIVLQEVPQSCAYVLQMGGSSLACRRPRQETFGANIGTLLRDVFEHELRRSGFYHLVTEASAGSTYEAALELFGHQLGDEARAIAWAQSADEEA